MCYLHFLKEKTNDGSTGRKLSLRELVLRVERVFRIKIFRQPPLPTGPALGWLFSPEDKLPEGRSS